MSRADQGPRRRSGRAAGGVVAITPRALAAAIDAGIAPPVVDVRERDEFDRGRVPGASNVPFWRFLISRPDVPAARDERVVLYCGQGPRASIAGVMLRLRGYRRVELMDGHWAGWQRAALPEEQST